MEVGQQHRAEACMHAGRVMRGSEEHTSVCMTARGAAPMAALRSTRTKTRDDAGVRQGHVLQLQAAHHLHWGVCHQSQLQHLHLTPTPLLPLRHPKILSSIRFARLESGNCTRGGAVRAHL